MKQYSELYQQQVKDLRAWFAERLPELGPLKLVPAEIDRGTDSLMDKHKDLITEAFREWLIERQYELSYNQMCNAFFAAALECGVLIPDN